LTARLAKALTIAALILFLISGADVATNAAGGQLLGLSTMVRGMIFGFGAVALATAAFFVSMKQGSTCLAIDNEQASCRSREYVFHLCISV